LPTIPFFSIFLLKIILKELINRKSVRQPFPQSCKFRFQYNRKSKLVANKKQIPGTGKIGFCGDSFVKHGKQASAYCPALSTGAGTYTEEAQFFEL
jgi:hypothetical protein